MQYGSRLSVAMAAIAAMAGGCLPGQFPMLTGAVSTPSPTPEPNLTGEWLVARPGLSAFKMEVSDRNNGTLRGAAEANGVMFPLAGSRIGRGTQIHIILKDEIATYTGTVSADAQIIEGHLGINYSATDTFTASRRK